MASTARNDSIQGAVAHKPGTEDRAYHEDASSKYVLPKDAKEHSRLEGQAQALETVMGGDVLHAPIEGELVARVLDVGCGTGYVTDKLSRKFPKAEVYGLDLSPVPRLREQGSNIEYLQGNIMTQKPTMWTGPGGPVFDKDEAVFDYIFSRLLIAGMTDWPGLLKKEFALLKPGGYVEHHEVDFTTFSTKGEIVQLGMMDFTKSLGMDHQAGMKMEAWLKDAGFVDVEARKYHLPWGGGLETDPAMKEVGDFWYQDVCEAFSASMHGACRILGRPVEEAEAEIKNFHDLNKPNVGNYTVMYAVYGRKP